VKTLVASLFGTIAPQDVVLLKSIEMLECSLRLLLHYLKDGTVHIPPNHYLSATPNMVEMEIAFLRKAAI